MGIGCRGEVVKENERVVRVRGKPFIRSYLGCRMNRLVFGNRERCTDKGGTEFFVIDYCCKVVKM